LTPLCCNRARMTTSHLMQGHRGSAERTGPANSRKPGRSAGLSAVARSRRAKAGKSRQPSRTNEST
jgi:hypothetical protein